MTTRRKTRCTRCNKLNSLFDYKQSLCGTCWRATEFEKRRGIGGQQ
jgi:hypothetical protein